MTHDAKNILWTDTAIFQNRYEKSASALVAVKQALERNRPLGGGEQEFLDLYQIVADGHPDHFTSVWRDPTAYFWVRMAYQLLGTCLTDAPLQPLAQAYCGALGTLEPREALAHHLADFKRFVLALHVLSGGDSVFTPPFHVSLPFAVPGTRLSLSGTGSALIHSVASGHLEVSYAGRTGRIPLTPRPSSRPDTLTVHECPVTRYRGYELPLHPHAFNLPGLDFISPVLDAGLAYQNEHVNLVAETLALIERYQPAAYAQFRDVMRFIALKPQRTGNYTNISHSDLPGAFICGVVHEPLELGDTLLHEFHHNRLFFIEEIGPFFVDPEDNLQTTGAYYSPWRSDLRPLHGIFHALYVYLPVCRFWLEAYRGGDVTGRRLDYVRDRVVRIPLQLAVAVQQLARYARFTEFGTTLFEQMRKDVAEIRDAIIASSVPLDVPAVICSEDGTLTNQVGKSNGRSLSAREAVLEHIRNYDLHKQCHGLPSD